ncbi:leucine-rich repeat protein [Tanacetum coccineum]|uniref:Leucine-rich repeat protein n=1 Tax=Tanacetum coccineum TaxID=301880 RepID=A0ABQ4X0M1_9ASTR
MKSPQAVIYLSTSSPISFLIYGLVITCLTSATVSASYGSNETDYHALLSFKSTITHDPDKVLTSWNDSFHFCEWSGTTAFKEPFLMNLVVYLGYAIFILTDNNFIGGPFQYNYVSCFNLEVFQLLEIKLGGSIPKEMSLFSKLTSLEISKNKLTGGIPSFLGNITSMEVFSCVENPLGGSIPDTLGLWKSLTTFYSGGCNLYGSIPRSIFNLSLLINLSLAENHLAGSLPSEIGNQLPNLEYLQLRDNELTGVLPPSISNCSNLGYLEMANNKFSAAIVDTIVFLCRMKICYQK